MMLTSNKSKVTTVVIIRAAVLVHLFINPSHHQEAPSPGVKKKRKRRKRQLIFFDPETQLTQETLQRQIEDALTETRPPHLLKPPSHRPVSAAGLLDNPCTCQ